MLGIFNPQDHIKSAPCYWHLMDDGGTWLCKYCDTHLPALTMRFCLSPAGKVNMICAHCLELHWAEAAKKMPEII